MVERPSGGAHELTRDEIRQGLNALRCRVLRYRPRYLAVISLLAYRIAFDEPHATAGPQQQRIGETRLWLLPNPSPRNRNHDLKTLVQLYGEIHEAAFPASA